MDKLAYETYFRDKSGTLRKRLVDAVTGQPITNTKGYTVLDATQAQDLGIGTDMIQGEAPDVTPTPVKKPEKSFRPPQEMFKGGRGNGPKGSKGKSKVNGPSNNFGFINKPGWSKLAVTAAGMINPIAGAAARAIDVGINVHNIESKNAARKALGLPEKDESFFAKAKDVVKGPDKTFAKDFAIGDNKYDVSFGGGVNKKGKGSLTFNEAVARREALDRQKNPEKYDPHLKSLTNPQAKLHPELDPSITNAKSFATPTQTGEFQQLGGLKNQGVKRDLSQITGITVHHTATPGVTDPQAIVNGLNSRNNKKGLGVNFVMDRAGIVHQVAPLDRAPPHMLPDVPGAAKAKMMSGDTNANMIGIEVMAADDEDITPEQRAAFPGFVDKMMKDIPSIRADNVLGHGMLNTHKEAREGYTLAETAYFGEVPSNTPGIPEARPEQPNDKKSVAQSIVDRAKDPKTAFFDKQYAYAKEAGLTGIMADVAVSQAALETGYGTSELSKAASNYHGIKATPDWTGKTYSKVSPEERNGVPTMEKSDFRQYENPVESYKDWAAKMAKNYPGMATATNINEAVSALENGVMGRYALDSDYGSKLTKAYGELQSSGVAAENFSPEDDSSFSRYSKSFYAGLQKQPDPQDAANNSRFDTPSSTSPSFGANRPATGNMNSPNMGRPDTPSSGRSSFGSSYSNTPSAHSQEHERDTSLSGLGNGLGNTGKSPGATSFGGGFNGPGGGSTKSGSTPSGRTSTSDKDKDRSASSFGGFGNYAGGGEKV